MFVFENFNETSEAKGVSFKNITVKNIDFSDHKMQEPDKHKVGRGSFIKSMNSNLLFDDVQVTSLSSMSNSSFLLLDDSVNQTNGVSVMIQNSNFNSCSSAFGGVIFSSANVVLNVSNTNFTDNYAYSSAVIHMDSDQ